MNCGMSEKEKREKLLDHVQARLAAFAEHAAQVEEHVMVEQEWTVTRVSCAALDELLDGMRGKEAAVREQVSAVDLSLTKLAEELRKMINEASP